MSIVDLSRRKFITKASLIPIALLSLQSCSEQSEPTSSIATALNVNQFSISDSQVIKQFIKHIVPVAGLRQETYAEISNGLFVNSETDQGLANNMRACIEALNAQVADWVNTDNDSQIAAINQVSDQTWFAEFSFLLKVLMYRHPKVWDKIGYDGPSLQFGGYKGRGHNEIAWLDKMLESSPALKEASPVLKEASPTFKKVSQ